MDFEYTEEQKQLKKEVAAFAKRESAALPKEYVLEQKFPWDLWRKIGEKKWFGPMIPKEYGGMGKGCIEYAIMTEELRKEQLFCLQPSTQTGNLLLKYGTEEQRKKFLPKVANGEYVSAAAISEPNAGSSFKYLATTAKKENGFYVINGRKSHINNAAEAGLMNMLVVAEGGPSYVLIEKGTPGIRFIQKKVIGFRIMPVYEIILENARIPEDHLVGKEGQAVEQFLYQFNIGRIGNASMCIGLARYALEHALEYAKNRKVGDSYVTDFQGLQWMLADAVTELESAKLLRDKAAWLVDQGGEMPVFEASMAKVLAAEMCERVASLCFRLMGGVASYSESVCDRILREAKAGQVAGGSDEVVRNEVARHIIRKYKV